MRREHLPHAIGLAVLAIGLVVGLAFAAVPLSAVLGGLVVLAGLMTILFVLGRRGEWDDPDEIAAPHAEVRDAETTVETDDRPRTGMTNAPVPPRW